MDTGANNVPPIVFVLDTCDLIDPPFNVKETNFNVEDDISTSYFPPSKKSKCLSTIEYDDDSMSLVHSSTSSTADCRHLMMTYPLGMLSLLPIMQQISMTLSLLFIDQR